MNKEFVESINWSDESIFALIIGANDEILEAKQELDRRLNDFAKENNIGEE